MKKNKKLGSQYLAAAGIFLLVLTAVLQMCARTVPGFGTWYAHHIYPWIVGSVGRVTGLFPFSVVELGLYGLILLLALDVWHLLRKKWCSIFSRWLFITGALLFLYTANCGINYYASSFSSYAGLEDGTYTVEELDALCSDLVELVNESAKTGRQVYRENRSAWAAEAVKAMQAAGRNIFLPAGFLSEAEGGSGFPDSFPCSSFAASTRHLRLRQILMEICRITMCRIPSVMSFPI